MNNSAAYAKLNHWKQLLRKKELLMGEVTEKMSVVVLDLIDKGFEAERDPYGNRWAPKKRDDGRKVLAGKTSRLRRGWHARRVSARRYAYEPSVDYATAHQRPRFGRRPRRMMVPIRVKGLPRAWKRALSRTAIAAMHAHYTRR